MKEIYVYSKINTWNEQDIIIPIKFPFKSKKHLLDTIGSHWDEPEKILNILDREIKKGITYDIVLIVSNRGGQYKRTGIKQIRFWISYRPYRLRIEELRLHEKNIKKGRYSKYLIPKFTSVLPFEMTKKDFIEGYKGFTSKHNDVSLFLYSFYYVLYNSKALYM